MFLRYVKNLYVKTTNNKIKAVVAQKLTQDGEVIYKVFNPMEFNTLDIKDENITKIIDISNMEEESKKFLSLLPKFVSKYCYNNEIFNEELKQQIYYSALEMCFRDYNNYLEKYNSVFIDFQLDVIEVLLDMYQYVKNLGNEKLLDFTRAMIYEATAICYLSSAYNYEELLLEVYLDSEYKEKLNELRNIKYSQIVHQGGLLKEIF